MSFLKKNRNGLLSRRRNFPSKRNRGGRALRVEELETRALLAVVTGGGIDDGAFSTGDAITPDLTKGDVIYVTTTADRVADDGVISLREAIGMAKSGDVIKFDSKLAGKTVSLSPVTITESITIDASDFFYPELDNYFDLSISGGSISSSLITVTGGTNLRPVKFIGLQFSVNSITVSNQTLYGGIISNSGVLSISDCKFDDNELQATNGSIYGGVGIYNQGRLNATRTVWTNNSINMDVTGNATLRGGAVCNRGGTLSLNECEISYIEVSGTSTGTLKAWGAGLFNGNGTMSVSNSQITYNLLQFQSGTSYAYGAGISNGDGSGTSDILLLYNTLVRYNSAMGYTQSHGGGILNYDYLSATQSLIVENNVYTYRGRGYGGGIANYGSTDLISVTLTENIAAAYSNSYGGGVYNDGDLYAVNTILVNNMAETSGPDIYAASGTTEGHYVLTGYDAWNTSDHIYLYQFRWNETYTELLNPLFTDWVSGDYTLVPGSEAINVGANDYAYDYWGDELERDFAGLARIAEGTIDLGAYESSSFDPDFDISIIDYSGTYDANAHGIRIENLDEGDTVYFSQDREHYSMKPILFTNAGSWTVYVKVYREGYAPWSGSGTVNIDPIRVIVRITADDKVYNGLTTASGSFVAEGFIDGDDVSLAGGYYSFNNKHAGTNKPVTFRGYSLNSPNSNYVLANSTATTTATIYPLSLTITGTTVADKDYDGTTTAEITPGKLSGVISTDSVTLSASGEFPSSDPGTYDVTVSYSLSGINAGNYLAPLDDVVSATIFGGESEKLQTPSLSVQSAGANRHRALWEPVDHASAYRLAYSNDGVDWNETDFTTTSELVTGLTYGDSVAYRLKAMGDGVNYEDSDWSPTVSLRVCPMDANGDGIISGSDLTLVSKGWLSRSTSDRWDERADINGDNVISGTDLTYLSINWLHRATADNLTYPDALAAIFDNPTSDFSLDEVFEDLF